MRHLIAIVCFGGMLGLSGCKPTAMHNSAEFATWLGNPQHGMIVNRSMNGINMQAKFLPNSYLALVDCENGSSPTKHGFDSLLQAYAEGYTFLLTLGPEDLAAESFDAMYAGVDGVAAFKERVQEMHFGMAQQFELRGDDGRHPPTIVNIENDYGLANQRSLYVVFERTETLDKASQLTFTWKDHLFETGINHFVFDQSNLNAIPAVSIN